MTGPLMPFTTPLHKVMGHYQVSSRKLTGYLIIEMFSNHIPNDFEQKVHELCCEFVCGKTNLRVARKTMTLLKQEHVGTELRDFCALVKTKQRNIQ